MSKRSNTIIEPEVFSADNGQAIARWTITRAHPSGEPYYEQEIAVRLDPAGPFIEVLDYWAALRSGRASGNLPSGEHINLMWSEGSVEYGEVIFPRSDQAFDPASVERLPASWRTEYFCALPRKEFLLVHRDANHLGAYRALIGDGGSMREVEVLDFARYRGSSPTVVTTTEGTLVAPLERVGPPQPGDRMPTWDGVAVRYLAKADYVIKDADGTVTISSPKKERAVQKTVDTVPADVKQPTRAATVIQRPSLLTRLFGRG
jgi:hypothetical protein